MAREAGLSRTAARRIRKTFGLQPHRSETSKLSSDPLFVDKTRDTVGLYPGFLIIFECTGVLPVI